MVNGMLKSHPKRANGVDGRGQVEGAGLRRRDASASWMRQLHRLLQRKSSPSPVTKEERGDK